MQGNYCGSKTCVFPLNFGAVVEFELATARRRLTGSISQYTPRHRVEKGEGKCGAERQH